MRHGNLLLHGWYMSDISFFTTKLPQYALLESFFGVHQETAHIVAGIMLAPQLGNGVYALDVAVGHIGTAVLPAGNAS